MDTLLEYAAVILGVAYVLLATRSIIWCWPVGIVCSAIYIYLNIHQNLFQDAILQLYYVLAGFYGWWLWYRKEHKEEPDFLSYNLSQNAQLIIFGALLVPVFGYVFGRLGNTLSYYDSMVTVFSFISTWMTAKKILQNWLYWVLIDLVAGIMYSIKGMYPTTALYAFYTVIAIYGYYQWKKEMVGSSTFNAKSN